MPSVTQKWFTAIAVGGSLLLTAVPAHATEIASPAATGDGGSSGTTTSCAWTYKWHYDRPLVGGYTEVEWTKNPCGLKIEDETVCETLLDGSKDPKYSGIVKAINLWDKASCGDGQQTESGWERHTNADGSWTSWHEYWPA